MNKQEVKKMLVETFENFYKETVESFERVSKEYHDIKMIELYFTETSEKMYGYVIAYNDLYSAMTKTLRSNASDIFYPVYKEYRTKLWEKYKEYRTKTWEIERKEIQK